MILLLFYVALALGVSFLCSIMEAVLLSISTSYIARLEQQEVAFVDQLKKYKKNIDKPLAAILSLNTIAHTVGAAGAGAQAAVIFGEVYLGVISAILTMLILVLSEIIPKTLGAAYWKQLTPLVLHLLKGTIWCMYPLVKMSEGLTSVLTKNKPKRMIEREEFIALADLGNREGIFNRYESRVLNNLFVIREIRTKDIMTPRTVLFALKRVMTVGEVLQKHPDIPFSRILLYDESLDDTGSFVLKNEVLRVAHDTPALPLEKMERPLLTVPCILSVHDLFEQLMNESAMIALVVDEYGGTEGIVTLEDVLETLIGLEIVDEFDTVEDMQAMARKQWEKRAKKWEKGAEGEQNSPAPKLFLEAGERRK